MPLVLLPEIGELGVRLVHSLDVAGLPGVAQKLHQFTGSRFYGSAGVPGRFPNAVAVLLVVVWQGVTCWMPDQQPVGVDLALFDCGRGARVEGNVNPVIIDLAWRQEYRVGLCQFEPELTGACAALVLHLSDSTLVNSRDGLDYYVRIVRSSLGRLHCKNCRLN